MNTEIFTLIKDINIRLINIERKELELSRMFLNIEFYENIFSPFMSGKITIADTLDLLMNFSIVGNEVIKFDIHSSDMNKSISLDFRLYKIAKDKDVTKNYNKRKIYEIYFCSEEALVDKTTKISKKYNTTATSIVQDAIDKMSSSKTLNVTTSNGDIEVFSNFWTPIQLINFVARQTKGSYYDYIFYENFNGFNFKAISDLISKDSLYSIEFNYDTEAFIGNINTRVYKFESYFDLISSLKDNVFGTTFYKPHDTEYSFSKTTTNLSDALSNSIMTNGCSNYFDPSLSSEDNLIDTNFYDPEVSAIRIPSLNILQNYNLVLKLNGDFSRTCGDNVNVEFPSLDNVSELHNSFNGNWLITGIKHIIGQDTTFTQNVVLGKNAFFKHNALENLPNKVNI